MSNWYTINHPITLHTHTMKPSDPLLLTYCNLRFGMYPAGKVAISQHLAIPRFPQNDQTVGKLSADAGVVKYSRPPDLKSSLNLFFLLLCTYILVYLVYENMFCYQHVLKGEKELVLCRGIWYGNLQFCPNGLFEGLKRSEILCSIQFTLDVCDHGR